MTTPTSMPPESRYAFAQGQLDRLMNFFPRVESKATFILALNVAMFGVLALNYPVRHAVSPRGFCGIVAVVLLTFSTMQLYYVFFPHLKPGEKHSLFYFSDIAATGWPHYHQAVQTADYAGLLEDVTCQIWRNAEILRIKFDRTRAALTFMLLALPFWVALLLAASLREGKFVIGS